ncbi:hypothetical protein, partial [Salmonella sp. s54836]|uniref:hypothetical protein n=1 Tax=Salmonella sp. s54836 TaxID=3159673 RepID=UPI00397FACD4
MFHEYCPHQDKLQLDLRLNLISTAQWLVCPSFLNLYNQNRSIRLNVNPGGLEPGAHYAEIQGFICQSKIHSGPIFRIPVTIIIPHNYTKPFEYECD